MKSIVWVLYTMQGMDFMYSVHCTLYTVQCHCTLQMMITRDWTLCIVYIVHCEYQALCMCTMYTVHCTLYNVHCTLYIYIVQCRLCIKPGIHHCTVYIILCILSLYIVHYYCHCTMYNVQCTVYIVHCILYTVHYTLYIVHFTLYTVQFNLYTVHCKLYIVHCTLYTLHCTQYIVHCTSYMVHCTVYTVHQTRLYVVHIMYTLQMMHTIYQALYPMAIMQTVNVMIYPVIDYRQRYDQDRQFTQRKQGEGREGLGEGDGRRGGEMGRINTKHRGNRERGFRGGVKR